jgi:hypothetical protein
MIRSIVVCAALAFVLAATNSVGLSQSRKGEAARTPLRDRDRTAVTSSTDAGGLVTTYGSRRFEPLYEGGRPAPSTDDAGWPADWEKWPHLSVEIFGATREFNATREYRNNPSAYGDDQSYSRRSYEPHSYGNGPYTPRGYGRGWGNRDLLSSDSGFVLRYGYPGPGSAYGQYPPSFGYSGPAYGLHPPSYGYGAYGGHPAYYDYGPRYWGDGLMVEPPGRYMPYFGW